MKNLSHMSMLLAALLALSPFTLAQQPQGQGDQDKLVGIVRNATQQYQDVTKAHRGWIQSCPRLRQRLRPWGHGHPLRQYQSAERTH